MKLDIEVLETFWQSHKYNWIFHMKRVQNENMHYWCLKCVYKMIILMHFVDLGHFELEKYAHCGGGGRG